MTSRRFRRGTPADRGKVVRWPAPLEPTHPPPPGWRGWLARFGPGFVTGAADVDPSLVLTATVAGAAYQYSLLWVVVLCIPFLWAVFAVSARIGHETRQGLVDLLRVHYGRKVAIGCAIVIIFINMAMIIADIMAVSDAIAIILDLKRLFFVALVAFLVWYILIFRDYRKITRALIWLALPLFAYVASAVMAAPSPKAVLLGTFFPHIGRDANYTEALIGILGSLLTPYILVWQTSSRREAAMHGEVDAEAESHMGTFVTTILSFSIIVAAGSVLHLQSAVNMTTGQAAEALRPVAGDLGALLFAIGIIGAGMVALPVLVASMCYSISESLGWRSGLSEHPWDAKGFYVLISIALIVGTVANFADISPVKALYWSQVLAGLLTIPVLVFILLLANDRRIMRTTNTASQNFWLGAAAGGLIAAGLVYVWWKF